MHLGIIIINNTLSLSLSHSFCASFIHSLGAGERTFQLFSQMHIHFVHRSIFVSSIFFFLLLRFQMKMPHGMAISIFFYLLLFIYLYFFSYVVHGAIQCVYSIISALTNLRIAMLPTICMAFLLDFNYFYVEFSFILNLCFFFFLLLPSFILLFWTYCCKWWLLHYCFDHMDRFFGILSTLLYKFCMQIHQQCMSVCIFCLVHKWK